MMKKENNVIRIEDHAIRLVRVEGDYVIFEITGRECGFKTTFRISRSQLDKLGRMIGDARSINALAFQDRIEHIHAKHREYTRCEHEAQMTYKYYDCRDCMIRIDARGGHVIICLIDDNDKVYRAISFCVQKYAEQIGRLHRIILDTAQYQF